MVRWGFKSTAAALTLALCLVVPLALNDLFLMLPAFILCTGIYEVVVVRSNMTGANLFADGSKRYSLCWGIFTISIGLLTLLMVIELIWVLGILMVWLASVVPFFSMRQRNEAGGRDNLQVLNTFRR